MWDYKKKSVDRMLCMRSKPNTSINRRQCEAQQPYRRRNTINLTASIENRLFIYSHILRTSNVHILPDSKRACVILLGKLVVNCVTNAFLANTQVNSRIHDSHLMVRHRFVHFKSANVSRSGESVLPNFTSHHFIWFINIITNETHTDTNLVNGYAKRSERW